MWILLSVLLLLLLIFLWILWARVVVCINSYQHQYYFSFGGLIKIEPVHEDKQILLGVRVPFYRFKIDPFSSESGKHKAKKKPRAKAKKKSSADNGRKLKFSFYLSTVRDALRTFTVRKMKLDLDTGDFVLNAQLTPVVVLLSRGSAELQVNYLGRTDVWIEIENQLIRLVPLLIRFIRKKYL